MIEDYELLLSSILQSEIQRNRLQLTHRSLSHFDMEITVQSRDFLSIRCVLFIQKPHIQEHGLQPGK